MEHNPAGFWRRLFAVLIDGILISIVASIINSLLGIDSTDDGNGVYGLIELLYVLLVPALWVGYTVGKKALGIRIIKKDGRNVHIGTMVMRYVVSGLFYVITLGIGLIVSAFMVGLREDKRAIHDFIAGTYVTRNRP